MAAASAVRSLENKKGLASAEKKRPHAATAETDRRDPSGDFKTRLYRAMAFLAQRQLTKEDIAYSATEEGGQFVGEVQINCLPSPSAYTGRKAPSRKVAEQNAAAVAIKKNISTIKDCEAELDTAKALKIQEKRNKFREKKAEADGEKPAKRQRK